MGTYQTLIHKNWLAKAFLFIALLGGTSAPHLYAQVPAVASFTPSSGSVGSIVTIAGTNFNTTPDNNVVFFGATRAVVNTATANQLTVAVPAGATYDYISVLNVATGLVAYSTAKFTPSYTPNSGTITANDFEPPVNLPISLGAKVNVAIGDLDGDGKSDLGVVSNDSLYLFNNTGTAGTISFAPRISFPEDQYMRSVTFGDLDGDGKPEMVVTSLVFVPEESSYEPHMHVYRNTGSAGNISFAEMQDFPIGYTGSVSGAYIINDMDADGKGDIVIMGNGRVSIFRNTSTLGAISFDERVDINTGFVYTYDMRVGDLDGDGKPDLAVANNLSASITVLRNTSETGTISFAAPQHYATMPFPVDVAMGDLDNDGKLDLVVISDQFQISLFKNISTTGAISLDERIDIATGVNSYSIALGDIDGDGKLDMVMTDDSYHNIFIFRNTSEVGTISYADHVVMDDYGYINRIDIGDIDGDGRPDLVGILGNPGDVVKILRYNYMPSSIADVDDTSDFVVYPNPATNSIVLKSNGNQSITHIEIIDISGRVVKSIKNNLGKEVRVDVSQLNTGNYIVRLQTDKGSSYKKLVKT